MAIVTDWFRSLLRAKHSRRGTRRPLGPRRINLRGSRPLLGESLEPRHLLSGVTLITHGHTGDTAEGGWIREMGRAMMNRTTSATPATPGYTEVQLTVASPDGVNLKVQTAEVLPGSKVPLSDSAHSGEIVVYLDWQGAQTLLGAGAPYNTVSVSAAIMPYLTGEQSITGLGISLAEQPLHLLGHSRGGSLVGMLAEDLGAEGVFVDQVTYLDPHPLLPGDYPVWENAVPQNVLFADSVWRTDGTFSGNEVGDFDGAHIVGSYDGQLSEELLGGNELFFNVGYFWEHLDVHLWYHGTIPATENRVPNDGTVDVPLDWYGGREPERLESGFAYSRIAGGPRPKQGLLDVENWSANRAAVDFGGAVWPSLFNLAVSAEGGGTLKVGDPLPVVFDYHDNDSDAAASFFLDTDQNPYNAGAVEVGGGTLLSTGGATVTGTETLDTAAASAGTYYIGGRLQDASGRTRYAYAPTAIALLPNDNTEPITIAGTNYDDRNGNAQRDSSDPSSGSFEPGLAGWTIRLYLDDGNGLLEPNADTLVDSATTDGSGAYSFTEVGPGQYFIAQVRQNGHVQTFPASPGTHTVTATGGQDVDSLDFGNFGASRILTVNSAGDGADANPGDGVAEDADGNTTLRAAIEEANAVANSADHPDAIFFALPGEGPHTIRPATALPNLKDPVLLDATRQAGYSGSPLIELDGSHAGDAVSGLKVSGGGSGSTICGFTINRFDEHGIFISHKSDVTVRDNYLGTDPTGTQDLGNGEAGVYLINAVNNFVHRNLISGNDQGIFVEGPVSSGNVITGNTIGTNAEGTAALKNRFVNIDIAAGSKNQIGGTAEGEGNLISGSRTGVSIRGTTASGNLLLGNKIGTNAAGTAAIRNTRGVKILDADQNVIGGAGAAGNLISGNTIGLLIQRGEGNLVEGNHIGVDAAGSAAVPNTRGVLIRDSQANQIGGEPNVISGNLREGLKIFGSSTNNVVGGNAIGTNAAGDAAVGNDMGVRISGLASANTIGGTVAAARNIISGNLDEGLLLTADNNTVSGNFIGTDATGTAALGNDGGVLIHNATGILIGGAEDGAGNVISGNSESGVEITGNNSTDNAIAGNLVGTNAAGDAAVGNRQGIRIRSKNTVIGGTAPGAGNVVSGNSINGIVLRVGSGGTTIAGNRIGLSAAGDDSVGNRVGVLIEEAADNTVGGTAAEAGNSIGGNRRQGIKITGAAAAGNHIRGNAIGFDRQTGTVVANLDGVRITEGASGNSIGGTQAGAENEIAHNTRIGVWIGGGTGNAVLHNSIHDNGELGLAVESRLVTANDADDADAGANNRQNFPEFGAVTLGDGSLNIAYSVPTTLDTSAFPLSVEFFAADSNDQEGQTFLGSHSYTAIGLATATVDAAAAGIGTRIVATATDALGNTSEFSAAAPVASPLLAAGGAGGYTSSAGHQRLTAVELMTTVAAAISRLGEAGFSAELFSNITWAIADLSGATLGLATPATVTIDADAAGYGWYLDEAPQNDTELNASARRLGTAAEIDLLTVVMHELGHVAGLDDLYDAGDEDDLMYAWLQPGRRKASTSAAIADEAFAGL